MSTRDTIQFKVKGVDRLLTLEQLMANKQAIRGSRVRVIDTRTQKNWSSNLNIIKEKFR